MDTVNVTPPKAPISLTVWVTVGVVGMLITLFLAIGGSFLLSINNINDYKAQAAQAAKQEQIVALKAGSPLCRTIVEMDDASHVKPAPIDLQQNTYGNRLAKAIHDLANTSHCTQIIDDLKNHFTYQEILVQQQSESKKHGS